MPCIFVYKICRSTFNNKESVIKSSVLFFILRLIQRYGQGIRISSDAYKMVILKEIYGSKSKVFFRVFFFTVVLYRFPFYWTLVVIKAKNYNMLHLPLELSKHFLRYSPFEENHCT